MPFNKPAVEFLDTTGFEPEKDLFETLFDFHVQTSEIGADIYGDRRRSRFAIATISSPPSLYESTFAWADSSRRR
jgi:hypothetical protein